MIMTQLKASIALVGILSMSAASAQITIINNGGQLNLGNLNTGRIAGNQSAVAAPTTPVAPVVAPAPVAPPVQVTVNATATATVNAPIFSPPAHRAAVAFALDSTFPLAPSGYIPATTCDNFTVARINAGGQIYGRNRACVFTGSRAQYTMVTFKTEPLNTHPMANGEWSRLRGVSIVRTPLDQTPSEHYSMFGVPREPGLRSFVGPGGQALDGMHEINFFQSGLPAQNDPSKVLQGAVFHERREAHNATTYLVVQDPLNAAGQNEVLAGNCRFCEID